MFCSDFYIVFLWREGVLIIVVVKLKREEWDGLIIIILA